MLKKISIFPILVFLFAFSTTYNVIDSTFNAAFKRADKVDTYVSTDFKQSYIDEQTVLAHQYNQDLIHGVKDDNYAKILNTDGSGMIGYLSVPSLGIEVPIFHETSDDSLSYGASHRKDTSFPASGKGTHAVIDNCYKEIKKLKKGDKFYVTVFNQTHEYEVDQINSSNETYINPDEEYVTLCKSNSDFSVRGKHIGIHDRIYIYEEGETLKPMTPFELATVIIILFGVSFGIFVLMHPNY